MALQKSFPTEPWDQPPPGFKEEEGRGRGPPSKPRGDISLTSPVPRLSFSRETVIGARVCGRLIASGDTGIGESAEEVAATICLGAQPNGTKGNAQRLGIFGRGHP